MTAAGPASGFGNWIVIDHTIDGQPYSTVYGHMWDDGVAVQVGDTVAAGQHIGEVGNNGQSTGAHLHLEVWQGGRLTGGSETDPQPWLDRAANPGSGGSEPPTDESTWDSSVVGTCTTSMPRIQQAAAKPARSPTTPPPSAITAVPRSAPPASSPSAAARASS